MSVTDTPSDWPLLKGFRAQRIASSRAHSPRERAAAQRLIDTARDPDTSRGAKAYLIKRLARDRERRQDRKSGSAEDAK